MRLDLAMSSWMIFWVLLLLDVSDVLDGFVEEKHEDAHDDKANDKHTTGIS